MSKFIHENIAFDIAKKTGLKLNSLVQDINQHDHQQWTVRYGTKKCDIFCIVISCIEEEWSISDAVSCVNELIERSMVSFM